MPKSLWKKHEINFKILINQIVKEVLKFSSVIFFPQENRKVYIF